MLQHAAIRKLLQGVSKGQRDNTCYTLALAYKVAGYDDKQTEAYLQEWNLRNEQPMRQLDVKRKVKSAFKKEAPAGPTLIGSVLFQACLLLIKPGIQLNQRRPYL